MTGEWPIKIVRLEQPAAARNRSAWLLSPAVFLLAAAATFSLFYLRTGSAEATTSRTGPLLDPRAASIQLRIDTQSSGLMLSWNRYSPAVQAASGGILAIDDGSDHRQLTLDRNHILNGSVFYRPASQDVSFRLDLRDGHGSDVAQILRVLDARPRTIVKDAGPLVDRFKNAELVPARASQPEPVREVKNAAKKPMQAEPKKIKPKVQIAQNAPALPKNTSTPLPDPPVISQPLSSPNPEPAALQPTVSQPAPAPNVQPAAPAPANTTTESVPSGPSPSYVPPRPLKWVKVDEQSLGVPKVAQSVDIKVKVKIDERGNVTSAHALIDGPKRDKKLMAAAAAAVREWKFEPAQAHGAKVASEETIVLHLGPEAQ